MKVNSVFVEYQRFPHSSGNIKEMSCSVCDWLMDVVGFKELEPATIYGAAVSMQSM